MKAFARHIAVVGVLFFAFAVQRSHAQMQVGIQGGLSVPNLSGGNNELSEGYTSRQAPNFGIVADVPVTPTFSIRPEVNFDGQGGRRNGLQPITTTDLPPLPSGGYYYANFKNMSILNYLEIPVLAEYSVHEFGVRLFANAGPYAGILLNATQKTSGTSPVYMDKNGTLLVMPGGNGGYVQVPPQSFNASTGVSSSIRTMNYGFAGGIGASVPISSATSASLTVRGLYGIRNIQTSASDGANHTGNLTVALGYTYELPGI